ncbi:MAG: type II and III secretion system protein family protein [Aquabacterium sp.]
MNVSQHLFAATAVALVCCASAQAATITLEPGQQKTWSVGQTVARAATADEEIVGINVIPPRGIVITAKRPGTAMVSVWAEGRSEAPVSQFTVKVVPPSPSVILGKDGSGARVTVEGTRLRLSGALSSLEQRDNLEASFKRDGQGKPGQGGGEDGMIDASVSKFDVQVRIDIKMVEVSRSKLKAAGFYYQRFNYQNGRFAGSSGLSGPNNYMGASREPNQPIEFKSTSGFVPHTDAFNIFSVSDNVWAAFSALEANGFAYILAEPSLTTLSGQTATFLAGGELPIPLKTGIDSVVVQYKEFGVRMKLTPTVLDENRIAIKVAPEVSEVDPALSVQLGGYTIPGLRVRRTDTTVALASGETFVISGLVSNAATATIDKFPFLGDIPVLGAFFKSSRLQRDDKELLMIATAHLVRPFAKEAKLPQLPGEDARKYDPGFMHLLMKETGTFESPDSGFSK